MMIPLLIVGVLAVAALIGVFAAENKATEQNADVCERTGKLESRLDSLALEVAGLRIKQTQADIDAKNFRARLVKTAEED